MRLSLATLLFARAILASLPYKGVDWSSLLVEENAGRIYKTTAGKSESLESILKSSGVNTVRQRLWVNPSDGNYNLAYNLKLAARAKAAGLDVYLDMHFSDTWADPGHQTKPAVWASLSESALVTQVYTYTLNVCNTFQQNDLPLSIISIGNEITAGLLWPSGKLSASGGPKNAAALLKAASSAIKASNLSPKPKIMIHLDNGWNWSTQQWWYDTVLASGGGLSLSDFDIQGVSYYPFYNSAATLSSLGSSLSNMVGKYSKQVMVVETNWPTSCPSPAYTFPSDTKSIPFSVAGQETWIKDVAAKVTGAGSLGTGLFYWEPAWIDNAGLGSSCAWNLFVTNSGQDMGSFGVFNSI